MDLIPNVTVCHLIGYTTFVLLENGWMRKKRVNQVSTRLTDDELKLLERLAEKKGVPFSTLLRITFLDYAARNGETVAKS